MKVQKKHQIIIIVIIILKVVNIILIILIIVSSILIITRIITLITILGNMIGRGIRLIVQTSNTKPVCRGRLSRSYVNKSFLTLFAKN